MKTIVLTHKEWDLILTSIKNEYTPSIALISWKRREKLGFHVRNHSQWVSNPTYQLQYQTYMQEKSDPSNWLVAEPSKGRTIDVICLDFYDEKKRTMFLLKYGSMISPENPWNK